MLGTENMHRFLSIRIVKGYSAMKRIVSLLIFSLFLVTLFAGCGFDTSSESEGSHHTQKWVTWKSISTGKYHTMGIRNDGALIGWGWNDCGQIGTGSFGQDEIIATPTQIGTDSDWCSVGAGDVSALAIKTDGTLYTWGELDHDAPLQPLLRIGEESDWKFVQCGLYHFAALKEDNTLWVWGNNMLGQLGDDTTEPSQTPIEIDLRQI